MKTTAAKPMSQLERYILLTFGVLLTAVGVYFFKFPNNFSTGGVSGLSLILGRMLPSPVLTPSVFVFIINMALLVVGFIFLGRRFRVQHGILFRRAVSGRQRDGTFLAAQPSADQSAAAGALLRGAAACRRLGHSVPSGCFPAAARTSSP